MPSGEISPEVGLLSGRCNQEDGLCVNVPRGCCSIGRAVIVRPGGDGWYDFVLCIRRHVGPP